MIPVFEIPCWARARSKKRQVPKNSGTWPAQVCRGYILAVHHTGGVSSGGKSGKSGGKSGKSEVVEPWSPANLGWGGAMILETEEPTYYPSYFPTSLPTSTPTTYMPTTYIPT